MVRADELDREVNRLYWKTDEPVTRLAAQLDVSRGTFYNHLRPLPAGASCSTCDGPLLFRTRSSRDAGDAHCGECGGEERIGRAASTKPAASAAPKQTRTASQARPAAKPRAASPSRPAQRAGPRPAPSPPGRSGQTPTTSSGGGRNLAQRLGDDENRTQLLIIAVGAAALGLGILYFARHRS